LIAILLGIAQKIAVSGRQTFCKLFPDKDLRTAKPNRTILTRFLCPPYSSLQRITLESIRQDGKLIRGLAAALKLIPMHHLSTLILSSHIRHSSHSSKRPSFLI
jgi:hypothetical protein